MSRLLSTITDCRYFRHITVPYITITHSIGQESGDRHGHGTGARAGHGDPLSAGTGVGDRVGAGAGDRVGAGAGVRAGAGVLDGVPDGEADGAVRTMLTIDLMRIAPHVPTGIGPTTMEAILTAGIVTDVPEGPVRQAVLMLRRVAHQVAQQ